VAALSALDESLLRLAKEHGRLKVASAVKLTDANGNTVKLHLRQLTEAGRLRLLGAGRGVHAQFMESVADPVEFGGAAESRGANRVWPFHPASGGSWRVPARRAGRDSVDRLSERASTMGPSSPREGHMAKSNRVPFSTFMDFLMQSGLAKVSVVQEFKVGPYQPAFDWG
jgi:hypothetical protein